MLLTHCALRLGAPTLLRSQSALGANYRRLRTRLGAPKAIAALAHKLARLVYRMLKHGQEYVDKGIEHYEARFRTQRLQGLQEQARELNLQLTATQLVTDAAASALKLAGGVVC